MALQPKVQQRSTKIDIYDMLAVGGEDVAKEKFTLKLSEKLADSSIERMESRQLRSFQSL